MKAALLHYKKVPVNFKADKNILRRLKWSYYILILWAKKLAYQFLILAFLTKLFVMHIC